MSVLFRHLQGREAAPNLGQGPRKPALREGLGRSLWCKGGHAPCPHPPWFPGLPSKQHRSVCSHVCVMVHPLQTLLPATHAGPVLWACLRGALGGWGALPFWTIGPGGQTQAGVLRACSGRGEEAGLTHKHGSTEARGTVLPVRGRRGRPGEGVLNGGESSLTPSLSVPCGGLVSTQHTAHTWEETAPGDGSSPWGRGHAD